MIKYGITPEQYDEMVLAQGGVCAICKKADQTVAWAGRLHIDHCHTTGRVRGLLCSPCNIALGLIRDDPIVLLGMVDYLRAAPCIEIASILASGERVS